MQTFLIINLANIFIRIQEGRTEKEINIVIGNLGSKNCQNMLLAERPGQFVISTKCQRKQRKRKRNEKALSIIFAPQQNDFIIHRSRAHNCCQETFRIS